MNTILIVLAFFGFFLTYCTSKRAEPSYGTIYDWGRKFPKKANILGVLLLIFGLVLAVVTLGWGVGAFFYLMALMLLASLTVLISPLNFFSFKIMVIITVILLLIEIKLL